MKSKGMFLKVMMLAMVASSLSFSAYAGPVDPAKAKEIEKAETARWSKIKAAEGRAGMGSISGFLKEAITKDMGHGDSTHYTESLRIGTKTYEVSVNAAKVEAMLDRIENYKNEKGMKDNSKVEILMNVFKGLRTANGGKWSAEDRQLAVHYTRLISASTSAAGLKTDYATRIFTGTEVGEDPLTDGADGGKHNFIRSISSAATLSENKSVTAVEALREVVKEDGLSAKEMYKKLACLGGFGAGAASN